MTNLPGNIERSVGNTFGLRTWIECDWKHNVSQTTTYASSHGILCFKSQKCVACERFLSRETYLPKQVPYF